MKKARKRIQKPQFGKDMGIHLCGPSVNGNMETPCTPHCAPRGDCLAPSRPFHRARWILVLICFCAVRPSLQAQAVEEHEAKAAFVLKLINFVQWPAQHNNSLVIGIIGTDATSDALERLASGKSVDGREIVVRRLKVESDLTACQVVFIGSSEHGRDLSLLDRIRGVSVLTVGESDGFGQRGGIVNLMLDDGRIHIEVNPHAAERAHLQISSRLLALATIIRDGA